MIIRESCEAVVQTERLLETFRSQVECESIPSDLNNAHH